MTNPIPSEAEIEAAENAAKQALAAVERLRKQREAAEKAATDKATLMAACEAAIDAGRFELVNGELVDAHASRGLSPDEKFILARSRGGHLEVVNLGGTMVVLDKALGDVSKGSQDPKLTIQEQLVLEWLRSGRIEVTIIEGTQYALDLRLSRHRAEARHRKEATRTAASTQEPVQPTVAAPDPDPAPSDPPSQATGGPVPTGAGDGGSPYGPPPGWGSGSLDNELFGGAYPPEMQSRTDDSDLARPGVIRRFGRRIFGDDDN